MDKPRVIKDYDKLDQSIQEQIKLNFPYGFENRLIRFKNKEGKFVSALPFETSDRYYLVRMTPAKAQEIVLEDDDYSDDGILKNDVIDEYTDKYVVGTDDVNLSEDTDLSDDSDLID